MAQEMNLWTRLKSESPAFFVKLQNVALGVITSLTAIYLGLQAIPAEQFTMLSWGNTVYGYLIVASVVLGVVSKTTIKDK